MKNIRFFLSENYHILVVKFSVYLNMHIFVMSKSNLADVTTHNQFSVAERIYQWYEYSIFFFFNQPGPRTRICCLLNIFSTYSLYRFDLTVLHVQ